MQSSKQGESSENESQMNIETDVNLTKKKRIIFWAYLFAILCFAITVTVLAAKSWQATTAFTSTDSYYYAFQVAQDWKLGTFPQIQALSRTSLLSTETPPTAPTAMKQPSTTTGQGRATAATATPASTLVLSSKGTALPD